MNLWKYPQAGNDSSRSFDELQAQVRRRGHQFMAAMQQEFPGPQILVPYLLSYSQSTLDIPDPVKRNDALRRHVWALEPAFVAGMLEAATGTTSFTDGNEGSYWYADSTAFRAGARAVKVGALALVPPELAAATGGRVRVGQAVFADYLLGIYTWPPDTVAKHVAPGNRMKRLEYNVFQALQNSDEYAWIYSQKMNWWKQDSLPARVHGGGGSRLQGRQQRVALRRSALRTSSTNRLPSRLGHREELGGMHPRALPPELRRQTRVDGAWGDGVSIQVPHGGQAYVSTLASLTLRPMPRSSLPISNDPIRFGLAHRVRIAALCGGTPVLRAMPRDA